MSLNSTSAVRADNVTELFLGKPKAKSPLPDGVSVTDFYAYMPAHSYIFAPTRESWPATSVDSRINPIPMLDSDGNQLIGDNGKPRTLKASRWIDQNRPVEQMTWAPGEPEVIEDRLISDGGWIVRPGCRILNLYRPPAITLGDPMKAGKWIKHVERIYDNYAPHITDWLAHRVQRPHQKLNHCLVLGGDQGIGKDTLLEPVKAAIGDWNFQDIGPSHLMGRFNSFAKSVILRVSEARDHGEHDRYSFYEHMKVYAAAPPNVLRVDEKNIREYSVLNVTGVIITTNHLTNGIYLPQDDRRHYVAWSDCTKDDFQPAYWNSMWAWYEAGGIRDVAAFLMARDLSDFDPKSPPTKTEPWQEIVNSSGTPEDAELADALDQLFNPDVVTIEEVIRVGSPGLIAFMSDRKNSRSIPHKFKSCNYMPVRNKGPADGYWKINYRRQVVYAKKEIALNYPIADSKIREQYGIT